MSIVMICPKFVFKRFDKCISLNKIAIVIFYFNIIIFKNDSYFSESMLTNHHIIAFKCCPHFRDNFKFYCKLYMIIIFISYFDATFNRKLLLCLGWKFHGLNKFCEISVAARHTNIQMQTIQKETNCY